MIVSSLCTGWFLRLFCPYERVVPVLSDAANLAVCLIIGGLFYDEDDPDVCQSTLQSVFTYSLYCFLCMSIGQYLCNQSSNDVVCAIVQWWVNVVVHNYSRTTIVRCNCTTCCLYMLSWNVVCVTDILSWNVVYMTDVLSWIWWLSVDSLPSFMLFYMIRPSTLFSLWSSAIFCAIFRHCSPCDRLTVLSVWLSSGVVCVIVQRCRLCDHPMMFVWSSSYSLFVIGQHCCQCNRAVMLPVSSSIDVVCVIVHRCCLCHRLWVLSVTLSIDVSV